MSEINWKSKCWVTTIFLVNEGKVLLSFNNNLKTWIPVGGHIDLGENPEEAIIREVREETGFDFEFLPKPKQDGNGLVKVLKPMQVQIEKVPHHGEHINIIFAGKCTRSFEKETTDDNERLKWFSMQELEEMKGKMLENVRESAIKAIGICTAD